MSDQNSRDAMRIAIHPIHAVLVPFPITLFVAALCADLAYWKTADPLWTTMSSWLLLAGLTLAGVAVLAELIGVLGDRSIRRWRPAWVHLVGNGLAVLLSALNFVFHVRDGYSAVVPAGLLLSMGAVLILFFTDWVGPVQRHRAGDADNKEA